MQSSDLDLYPVSVTPDEPCTVLFFSAGRKHPFSPKEPYRDERYGLGYWDGSVWRWCGTAHEVWEFDYHKDDPNMPTHYAVIGGAS